MPCPPNVGDNPRNKVSMLLAIAGLAAFLGQSSLLLLILLNGFGLWWGYHGRGGPSAQGKGESLCYITEFCVSWLQICRGGCLLAPGYAAALGTSYNSSINSCAMARFYPTLGHFCYKRKWLWLAFCALVLLFNLSLFVLFAKTDFWSFPGIGTFWNLLFLEGSVCLMDAAPHMWEMGTW